MKSTYKGNKTNNESNNIKYKKKQIIKTMSYRINKDPIQIRDTTSPIPSYIELQKERSCTSKLFNSTPTNIITNKVDEFIKNFRTSPQQESGSISSLDQIFHLKKLNTNNSNNINLTLRKLTPHTKKYNIKVPIRV